MICSFVLLVILHWIWLEFYSSISFLLINLVWHKNKSPNTHLFALKKNSSQTIWHKIKEINFNFDIVTKKITTRCSISYSILLIIALVALFWLYYCRDFSCQIISMQDHPTSDFISLYATFFPWIVESMKYSLVKFSPLLFCS